MNDTNNYGKVLFDRDTATTIAEILQKYGLEEKPDEISDKLEREELLNGDLILTIVEEIVLGTTQENDLVSLIKERLMVSDQTAQGLAADVKEKLLLGARRATPEEIAEQEKPSTLEHEQDPILEATTDSREDLSQLSVLPPKPIEQNVPLEPGPTDDEIQTPSTQFPEKENTEKQPPTEPKKDDAYREPIN